MSIGKYSPTVSSSYAMDQNWWERNGGGFHNGNDPNSLYDNDGYDSYGYNENDRDRAGQSEFDYLADVQIIDDETVHGLYESVSIHWAGKLLGDLPDFVKIDDPKYDGLLKGSARIQLINAAVEKGALEVHRELYIHKSKTAEFDKLYNDMAEKYKMPLLQV